VAVIQSSSVTANADGGFVIGSQTLFPGGAITQNGEVITLPPTSSPSPVVVVGEATFTENSNSQLVIGSQTLLPGIALTVDGQVISMSDGAIIVNGAGPATTLSTITGVIPNTAIITVPIAGQTLTPGGRVTVGGDVLSLASTGTGIIVVGTVTVGDGETTATATAPGKKKNTAGKVAPDFTWVAGLPVLFIFLGALLY
jgi:hypothetical protein